MIDLYFSPTPNGLKVQLALEELELPYRLVPVQLSKGEQHAPAFLEISPNGKIPAIVDHAPQDGGGPLALFESGAILHYLADKCGRLLPIDPRRHWTTLQWLTWQVAGLGPMAGQAGYFRVYAPMAVPDAIDRYTREVARLYGVLDRRLREHEFVAGNTFSIADIGCFPWIVPHPHHGQRLADFPALRRWFRAMEARPATRRVFDGVEDVYAGRATLSARQHKVLFGAEP